MKLKLNLVICISALFFLTFTSCKKSPKPIIINNPSTAATINGFRNLDIHGSVKVFLTPDTINKADSSLNANLVLKLIGQTLSISGSGTATISIKQLDALTVTGSANVITTDSLHLDQLLITSHGSSTLDLKLIMKNALSIAVTGSSDSYVLSGRSPKFFADITGSPDIHAYPFSTADCSVAMTGSGTCEVFSFNSLTVDLKGSSTLYYKGNPSAVNTISIIGSSKLIKQ